MLCHCVIGHLDLGTFGWYLCPGVLLSVVMVSSIWVMLDICWIVFVFRAGWCVVERLDYVVGHLGGCYCCWAF